MLRFCKSRSSLFKTSDARLQLIFSGKRRFVCCLERVLDRPSLGGKLSIDLVNLAADLNHEGIAWLERFQFLLIFDFQLRALAAQAADGTDPTAIGVD